MDLENKITQKSIEEVFDKHSNKILPIFFEMQSAFLTGVYKRYGDLEGGQIVIYFARNLHLNVMRKREDDLSFDLSLEKFWFNHQNTFQDKQKIISVSRFTGLPKETARRKIIYLTKQKHLKKTHKNNLYWEPSSYEKETYIKIIKEQIKSLSKFLFEQSKLLNIDISFAKINKEIEKNYCFYWYHYLSTQLEFMKYWQKKISDLEILLIGLQSLIQSLNYFKKKSSHNKLNSINSDISATSVSEVTGIPRATCIRKLEWLLKQQLVKKDPQSKRYNLNTEIIKQNLLDHPLTNMTGTSSRFAEFSSIVYKAVLR